jgi:hypothetical protein
MRVLGKKVLLQLEYNSSVSVPDAIKYSSRVGRIIHFGNEVTKVLHHNQRVLLYEHAHKEKFKDLQVIVNEEDVLGILEDNEEI